MIRPVLLRACALGSALIAADAAFGQAPPPSHFCGGFGGSGTPVVKPIIESQLKFDRSNPGFDCQMWQAFIFLNWPALPGKRGVPNPNAKFGAPGTTVWETYKTLEQTFLPNGDDPGPWDPGSVLSAAVPRSFGAHVAAGSLRALSRRSKISREVIADLGRGDVDPDILRDITQAFGGVLYDQNKLPVYYEIAMNEDQYNYIWKNHLYNADKQLSFAQGNTIMLPGGVTTYGKVGAIELKAAWKILSPAEIRSGKFHTAQAIVIGTWAPIRPVTVGLVGLHIFQMLEATNQGVWATFAQVDNAPFQNDIRKGPYNFNDPSCLSCSINDESTDPTQVVQMFADDPSADNVNKNMKILIQQANPASVWQYYKLIDVQWPENPIDLSTLPVPALQPLPLDTPNTQTLMNPVLETFMQYQGTSCTGCHTIARVSSHQSNATNRTPPPQNASSYSFMFGYARAQKPR